MMIFLLLLLLVLISIAFLTLLERKIFGLMHIRKGPNKLIIKGLFQPFSDGMKLFLKENLSNFFMNKILFNLSPLCFFFIMFLLWMNYMFFNQEIFIQSMLYFIILSSLSIYCIFSSGWASNSKYSLMGSFRAVAQMISYEVSMIFIILNLLIFSNSFTLNIIMNLNFMTIKFWSFNMMILIVWIIIMLAELNRTPFDFAESESELISGFNIEYSSGKFAFLFLSEYGNIIFISYLTAKIFMNDSFMIFNLFIIFFIIIIRGTFPRYRYDNLMKLNWNMFLPFSILYFFIMFFYNLI